MLKRLTSWLGKKAAPALAAAPLALAPAVPDEEVLRAILSVPEHFSGLLSILKDCQITRVKNAVSAGTSAQNTSVLDMTGFDSVLFVCFLGDVTINSVLTLTVYSNTANSTSGGTSEKAGTTLTDADGTSYDNGCLAVEVHKPARRYVFATLTRTAANAAIDGIFAIQFNARSLPQTQGATILDGVVGGPNA